VRPPGRNDQIVGDGGNATVYRRPDGSEYALDREGRGGQGKTKVYGPAKFDSRSKFSGGDAAGAGGALGILLLIVLPLAILAAIGWVLYHVFKWFFKQPVKTRLVILGVLLAITGIGVGIGVRQASVAAAARHRQELAVEDEAIAQEAAARKASSEKATQEAQEEKSKRAEEAEQERSDAEANRARESEEAAKERAIRARAKEDEAEAARSREAARSQQEVQEARMAKERTEQATAPGSLNKYPGETCVGPGNQEYKCSAAQKSESSPASRALVEKALGR
jgi:Skp family chaperone for outer membrane proteins